jgi:two-component system nitrate/nitrite response regulator NarL
MTSETVAVALDAIAAPAFLVRRAGGIEFANEAGRLLFERRGPSLARSVHTAVVARGRTEGVSVTPLQSDGAWSRAIVVLHGENASAEARLAVATVRWKLTPRQREVVALLARGDSNKDIAAKLRCTPRTAEVHVAAVLTKARVETRGQLIARFWNQV